MSLLDELTEPGGLSVVFQPIFQHGDDGWRVYALEALVRGPRGSPLERAEVLFEYVRHKGEEALIDRTCISTALRAAHDLTEGVRISLNVHVSTLENDREFVRFLERVTQIFGVSASRLTIELVESVRCSGSRALQTAIWGLRELGASIAVDDIGQGYANYFMMLECRPDYFKVDRYVVSGSSGDSYRQAVLRSIIELARSTGAIAVAEGVDNVADLETVLDQGFSLVQGFLLSPPKAPSQLPSTVMLETALRDPIAATSRMPVAESGEWAWDAQQARMAS